VTARLENVLHIPLEIFGQIFPISVKNVHFYPEPEFFIHIDLDDQDLDQGGKKLFQFVGIGIGNWLVFWA